MSSASLEKSVLDKIRTRILDLQKQDLEDLNRTRKLGEKYSWSEEQIINVHKTENWNLFLIQELQSILHLGEEA